MPTYSDKSTGDALHEFIKHVKSHDPEGVRAAVVLVANEISTDDEGVHMHICNFAGGNPDYVARLIVEAIKESRKNLPGFTEVFNKHVRAQQLMESLEKITGMVEAGLEELKTREIEGNLDTVKPQVEALMKKFTAKGD